MSTTYVVYTSRRSREKLQVLTDAVSYYAITEGRGFTGEDICEITEAKLDQALAIKGVRKFNSKGKELFKRWK